MKVLQVTTHINIGGIANYVLSLSGSLKAKGAEVLAASSGGNMEDGFRSAGIPHRPINIRTKFEFGPKAITSAFQIARIIKEENIDIIHAHTRVSQVAALGAARMTGIPYVTTCHGYFKLRSRKIFDTWGVRVIAISDAVAAHLKGDLGVAADRIKVIYSGVDIGKFARTYSDDELAGLKRSLGLSDGPIVGAIGRLSPEKGHRYLVQAMAGIIRTHPDAQCIIIGDGVEKSPLEALARDLKIENRMHFVKSSPETAKFLAIMDVFVFPSVKEGLGIALLEAMAAGKSCVASDIGGISDIITGPSTGVLVPAGSAGAISDAVLGLIDDNGRRQEMGRSARKLAAEKFSLDAMADKVIQLYKEVLSER